MILPQDGSVFNRPTVYPEINIFASSKTKEEAVSSANELLRKFVPEDIWPLTTITIREKFADFFVIHVTTACLDT